MSDDVIIRVEGLGKMYRIRHGGQAEGRRYVALRDVIAEKAKNLFKKLKTKDAKAEKLKTEILKSGENVSVSAPADVSVSAFQHSSISSTEDFWALKDVSFEVRRGEVVGIIGLSREIDFHQPTTGPAPAPNSFAARALVNGIDRACAGNTPGSIMMA